MFELDVADVLLLAGPDTMLGLPILSNTLN